MRTEDRVVLVTGGAGGLGLAIAARFAGEGARVIITDRDVDRGETAAASIGVQFRRQDVTDEKSWADLMADIADSHEGLRVLVNNAGIGEGIPGAPRDPERTSRADWESIFDVNMTGTFLGCKYGVPAIARSGGGAIVNISSVASLVPTPFITAYGASKAAVEHLSRSVALHCARAEYAIRCNSVHPGQVRTSMLNLLIDRLAEENGVDTDTIKADFIGKIPLGTFQDPSDIANAVYFLASDEARMITGQALAVDGGFCLAN